MGAVGLVAEAGCPLPHCPAGRRVDAGPGAAGAHLPDAVGAVPAALAALDGGRRRRPAPRRRAARGRFAAAAAGAGRALRGADARRRAALAPRRPRRGPLGGRRRTAGRGTVPRGRGRLAAPGHPGTPAHRPRVVSLLRNARISWHSAGSYLLNLKGDYLCLN